MAKGFSFEEALTPIEPKGFSFEDALPPTPTLSPEEQMMSSVGEGSGTEFKDIGKLATASAIKSVLGSPEAIQASASGVARDTLFKPMEAVNFLADPRKLTNTLASAVGMKPIFDESKGPIPEETIAKEKAAVDETLTKGKIESLRDLTKYGNEVSKMIEDTVSPEMKEALANSEPTGNILQALDTMDFSKVSMGKAPSAQGLFGQAARVFGSAAPGVLTSFITKSATPGAAFGFGQAGGEGIDTAREHISKMSDIALAKKSEYYRNLLILGYPPAEARKMTEDKAGDTAAYYQGIVGALGGAFTGNLVAGKLDATKLLNAKNVLTRIAKGATVGTTEEGAQELAEGIATDLGIDRTVVREIGVDSFANAVLGAIGGGGPGAVSGAMAKTDTNAPAAVPQAGVAPMAGAETGQVPVPPAVTPAAPAPVKMAQIRPEDLEEAEPVKTPLTQQAAPVTAVTPPAEVAPQAAPAVAAPAEKPTFDEWRTQQGITFSSKEDYEAALPRLKAEYQAEISGAAPVVADVTPKITKEEKAVEKALQGVRADEVPLHEFNLGILDAMNKAQPNSELVSEDAIKLLIANELVKQNANKKLELLPKGNQMLQALRDVTGFAKPELDADQQKALFARFIPQIATGEVVSKPESVAPQATEVVQEPVQVAPEIPGIKSYTPAKYELPKRSSTEGIPQLGTDAVLDSANQDVIKNVNEILKDYEVESGQSIEGNYLHAVDRDLREKQEQLKAPPITKNSVVPTASIEVAPYNGGFLASSAYAGKGQGYASPISVFGKTYATRQEAIDAEANRIRKYAQEDKNTTALKWLDSVSKPTKEGQVAINKTRQAEKKAKAEKPAKKEAPVRLADANKQIATKFANKVIKESQGKESEVSNYFVNPDEKAPQEIKDLERSIAELLRNDNLSLEVKEKLTNIQQSSLNKEAHIEGKKSEPVTSKTIEEAIDKAETKVDNKKLKKAITEKFYKAIKEAKYLDNKAWDKAKSDKDKFVIIDIPGDGKFAVKNSAERLKELQKKLINALPLKGGKVTRKPNAANVSAPEKVFADMVNEGEMENALEYARLKKMVPTNAGLTPQGIKNLEKALGGEKGALQFKAEIEGKPVEEVETYKESMERINAKMKAEGRESEFSKAAKELAETKAKIAELKAKESNKPVGEVESVDLEKQKTAPKTQAEIRKERQEAKLAAQKVVDEGPFYNNFDNDFTKADLDESILADRKEKIKEQAGISRRITSITKKVADVGSTLDIQAKLNRLIEDKKLIKEELDATKPERRSAEWFRAKASEGVAKKTLTKEAMAVVDVLYAKYPNILETLKLSIRQPTERGVVGNFRPLERLVTIYHSSFASILTGTAGEKQAATMRHEITHSLEQMMTTEQQVALVEAWGDGLAKAIKANLGPAEQEYFKAVLDFVEKPNKENFDKATNLMPDIDFYQYMNPSEFWAVNAEKLMKAKLGTPWARFVKAVQKIWEAIKSVFGFDNRYAVHREFDRIMKGDQQQMTRKMLADYVKQMNEEIEFLRNIENIEEENENVPEVPDTDPKTFKEMGIGTFNRVVDFAKDIVKSPKNNSLKALEKTSEGILYTRIKNVWFAAGLEARDFAKWAGQIRTSEGLAIASLAVKNAIHAGSVATQVLIQGGLEYSSDFLQFVAVKRDHSMKNVAALQYEIRKMLGRKQGDKTINAYLIAKRSRSIYNSYLDAQAKLETAIDDFNKAARSDNEEARTAAYNEMTAADAALEQAIIAYQKIPTFLRQLDEDGETIYETVEDRNGQEYKIPVLNDEEIDKFIDREDDIPQLAKILENFTAVNHNMIDMMVKGSRISAERGEKLKAIKDYVPWYRVMDESEELFDDRRIPSMPSNIKEFKKGETKRDIANIIDSMNHNVTMMTRSAIRNYAQVRIIQEYAKRKDNGRLQVYPAEGRYETGVRVPAFIAGRRAIFEIPDAMVAEAILGMISPPYEIPMQKLFSSASQLVRRTVTFSGYFQLKQLFYDAPTAAWVSGVKNPLALWGGCFSGFVRAVNPLSNDPVVDVLRSAGIGGFQSFHRTAKKEQDIELGMIRHSKFAFLLHAIDRIGDASDYSQRISTYNRVLKETGDKALAMMQAADVIDFQKHGNGRLAQALRVSVTFMQAYATQLDVLTQAMVGGNLKGQSRLEAAAKFHATGVAMASLMVLWAMMACGDDDYHELDDDTKARNLYLPYSKKILGYHVLIPLKSSAAMFYKVMPELIYYRISQEGTKNEMDKTRFWDAAGSAAVDMLLGPTPVPSAIKGGVEISLDRNFFTGGKITPNYLKGLEASRQYTASTSELGKLFSAATQIPFTGEKGKENKRVLSPIEADHLMRSLGGSVATTSMYFTNMVFNSDRPATQLKENPLTGGLIGADVPRRNENLYYDLKERADKVYATFQDLIKNDRKKGAEYREANIKMIQAHGYTSGIEQNLNQMNAQIRRLSRSEDLTVDEKAMTPEQKRERINFFNQKKQDILKDIIERRKAAGL